MALGDVGGSLAQPLPAGPWGGSLKHGSALGAFLPCVACLPLSVSTCKRARVQVSVPGWHARTRVLLCLPIVTAGQPLCTGQLLPCLCSPGRMQCSGDVCSSDACGSDVCSGEAAVMCAMMPRAADACESDTYPCDACCDAVVMHVAAVHVAVMHARNTVSGVVSCHDARCAPGPALGPSAYGWRGGGQGSVLGQGQQPWGCPAPWCCQPHTASPSPSRAQGILRAIAHCLSRGCQAGGSAPSQLPAGSGHSHPRLQPSHLPRVMAGSGPVLLAGGRGAVPPVLGPPGQRAQGGGSAAPRGDGRWSVLTHVGPGTRAPVDRWEDARCSPGPELGPLQDTLRPLGGRPGWVLLVRSQA